MMKNQLMILALIFIGSINLNAQHAALVIKNQNNSNHLYWVPSSFELWFEGLQNGYFVEKQNANGSYQRLNKEPLLDKAWQKQGEKEDNECANFIVRLYERQNSIPKMIKNQDDYMELQLAYSMYLVMLLEKPEHYQTIGNYFEDKSGKADDNYRILINNASQSTLATKIKYIKPDKAAQNIGKPKVSHNSLGEIKLQWRNDSINFSAYSIERSLNGGKFEKLSLFPILSDLDKSDSVRYFDSIGSVTAKLQYRISAYDAFGQLHTFKPIDYQLKDEQAPSVADLSYAISNKESRTVSLSWKKDFVENDFVGYNLYRSTTLDTLGLKLNKELLQKSKINHLDVVPENESMVYYTIGTLDFAGNESFSNKVQVVIPDKTPPAVPKNLKASVDEKGIVMLTWDKNKEADQMGYKLFASSQQQEGFVAISANHVSTNQTYDTLALNVSNREYFYKILAFDSNFNASPMSAAVQVLRPDTIPPQTPIIYNPKITDSSVQARIIHGDEDDLEAMLIFTKKDEKQEWRLFSTIKNFEDSLLSLPAENAFYTALTVDKNGNKSAYSEEKYVYIPDQVPSFEAVYDVKASVESESISLSWAHDAKEEKSLYHVFIIRETTEASPELIGSTSNKNFTFNKKEVPSTFKLFVVSQSEKNRTSVPSELISVSY